VKTVTDTIAKTQKIGVKMSANPRSALLRKLVQSISTNLKMRSQQTLEQKDADTKHFVIRTFAVSLAGIIWLFGYSVVFTEQPLFNESPVDKAIFGILTLVAGQLLQILANYITKAPVIPPPPPLPCPPVAPPLNLNPATVNLTQPATVTVKPAPAPIKPRRIDDDED
jgi:hypothetical protein